MTAPTFRGHSAVFHLRSFAAAWALIDYAASSATFADVDIGYYARDGDGWAVRFPALANRPAARVDELAAKAAEYDAALPADGGEAFVPATCWNVIVDAI